MVVPSGGQYRIIAFRGTPYTERGTDLHEGHGLCFFRVDGTAGHATQKPAVSISYGIEDSQRQAAGNLHRKDDNFLDIRSPTPQPAKHCRQVEPTGNALAYSVQEAFMA
jgi:hypothetical protein